MEQEQARREEEGRQLRPYRRFVRIVFFVALTVLCFLVLRGIIRSLDRLPSAQGIKTDGPLDIRALRACAEDLERLERRLRIGAAEALSREPDAPIDAWPTFYRSIDLDLQTIVARCHLDAGSNDPVVRDLHGAASAIEDAARSYALSYERHKENGLPRSRDALEAIRRATEALRTRR